MSLEQLKKEYPINTFTGETKQELIELIHKAYELGYNFAREEIKVTGECYPTVKARELLEMCNLTNKE